MPRPCILRERKEEAPRRRSWDHPSKKTHRLCLNVIFSGKQMEYSHLVTNCRNTWWDLEHSLVTTIGKRRAWLWWKLCEGREFQNFSSHHSCHNCVPKYFKILFFQANANVQILQTQKHFFSQNCCFSLAFISLLMAYKQGRNKDTDVKKRLMNTEREGEGGANWERSIETYTLSCVK